LTVISDVAGVLIPADSVSAAWRKNQRGPVFARENKIPYLGLCLGMQVATIEFARNVCGLEKANSTEFDEKNAPDPVICLLDEQRGREEQRRQHAPRHLATKIAKGTVAERFTVTAKCSSGTATATNST